MLTKQGIIVLILLMCFQYGFSQRWDLYTIVDTIPIKKSTKKKKLFGDLEKWFEKEKNVKLVRKNPEQYQLEGRGFLVYYNHVVIEDIFLSPRAAERTTGSIVYSIQISIKDSIVIAKFSNFAHEAYYTQYGKITFGSITAYETVPPGKCMENEVWCNAVWAEMKERAREETTDKVSRLVPQINIRKDGKSFKIEEEGEVIEEEDEKTNNYLDLDNYLIKDDD